VAPKLRRVPVFEKRRSLPLPGSIPDVLDIFRSELRFYQQIAPVIGIRVPECYEATETEHGTVLLLEDLSAWRPGGDPVAVAQILAELHRRWEGRALSMWPWLRTGDAAVNLVEDLYLRTWPAIAPRLGLRPAVADLGRRLIGRVTYAEAAAAMAGPSTLIHGDASQQNLRTSEDGELALLDWEDVSAAPGSCDLAWFCLSSVEPARWDETWAAYGRPDPQRIDQVLPALVVQGLLSFADTPVGSAAADGWLARLDAAAVRLAAD
jgi:phosphotransferase family enzyme